jgi:hypothetical protein
MENEQHKPIGIPTGGTSLSIASVIKEYKAKGIDVVVMTIGSDEEPRAFLERAMLEKGPCVVVIENIDHILKGKNLSDELEALKNPPLPIRNYRMIEPYQETFVQDKKKPWESQRKIQKFKKKGGR